MDSILTRVACWCHRPWALGKGLVVEGAVGREPPLLHLLFYQWLPWSTAPFADPGICTAAIVLLYRQSWSQPFGSGRGFIVTNIATALLWMGGP